MVLAGWGPSGQSEEGGVRSCAGPRVTLAAPLRHRHAHEAAMLSRSVSIEARGSRSGGGRLVVDSADQSERSLAKLQTLQVRWQFRAGTFGTYCSLANILAAVNILHSLSSCSIPQHKEQIGPNK